MTQYVAVKFKPSDHRTYTYHNSSEPVQPGDTVRVRTNDGEKTVTVESVTSTPPPFKTKPIIGSLLEGGAA